jgi:hypothetical protein
MVNTGSVFCANSHQLIITYCTALTHAIAMRGQSKSVAIVPTRTAARKSVAPGGKKEQNKVCPAECVHCPARAELLNHFRERLRDAIATEEFLLARIALLEARLPADSFQEGSSGLEALAGPISPKAEHSSLHVSAINQIHESPITVNSETKPIVKSAAPTVDDVEPRQLWTTSDRDDGTSTKQQQQQQQLAATATSHAASTAARGGGLFTPDPVASSNTGHRSIAIRVDTSHASVADGATSNTLYLLEQVLQGDNRLIARTPAPVRYRRSVYHAAAENASTSGVGGGSGSSPWQAAYGGVAPEGYVLFSPLSMQRPGAPPLFFEQRPDPLGSSVASNAPVLSLQQTVPLKSSIRSAEGRHAPSARKHRVVFALMHPSQWVRDDEAADCQGADCHTEFGLFARRHHCRACGGVFCSMCSSRTLDLEAQDGSVTQHRACEECFIAAATEVDAE